MVRITEKASGFYEFELDGVVIAENKRNDLTIVTTSGVKYCHFKTANGANILKKQNVLITEVTVIAADATESNPTTATGLFVALFDIGYFAWMGSGGGGGSAGVNKFRELIDAFDYPGNNGKVPVVNEALNKLEASDFYNYKDFTQLQDVAISALTTGMINKVVGVGVVGGVPKFMLQDPATVNIGATSYDRFLSLGQITQSGGSGEILTIPANAQWIISNVIVNEPDAFVTEIDTEADGFKRVDIIVGTTTGFAVIQGQPENLGVAVQPLTPPNTILATVIQIDGLVIGEPTQPIVDPLPLPNQLITATLTDLGVATFAEVTPADIKTYLTTLGFTNVERIIFKLTDDVPVDPINFDVTLPWDNFGIATKEDFEAFYDATVTNFNLVGERLQANVTFNSLASLYAPFPVTDIQKWPTDDPNFDQIEIQNQYLGSTLPDPMPVNVTTFIFSDAPSLTNIPTINPVLGTLVLNNATLLTEAQMDAAADQFLIGTLPKAGWDTFGSTPPSAPKQAELTANVTFVSF